MQMKVPSILSTPQLLDEPSAWGFSMAKTYRCPCPKIDLVPKKGGPMGGIVQGKY